MKWNRFTIKTKTIGDAYVQTTQCKMNKKAHLMQIPRFGLFELLNNARVCKKLGLTKENKEKLQIINKIKKGNKPRQKFNWQGKFQANQALVSNHIMKNDFSRNSTLKGTSGVTVKLNAGQGKTFLAMGLINKIQRKTLIVTHSETVLYDWTK